MRFRARRQLRFGPYFRLYSATVDGDGARGRFTSHGLKFGRLTVNLTRKTWTYDTPGAGSVSHSWGRP